MTSVPADQNCGRRFFRNPMTTCIRDDLRAMKAVSEMVCVLLAAVGGMVASHLGRPVEEVGYVR